MPSRMIDTQRLRRAKSIKDSKVLDFNIVQEDPVVAYCLIQGSTADPYTVIINCDDKYIAHYCMDFRKNRGWCKHFGKLLLLLRQAHVDQIYENKSNLRTLSSSEISTELEKLKLKANLTQPDNQDISIEDRIANFCQVINNKREVSCLFPPLLSAIEENLSDLKPPLNLVRIHSLYLLVTPNAKSVFLKLFQSLFGSHLNQCVSELIARFWVMRTTKRMEYAYLIGKMSEILKSPVNLMLLSPPDDICPIEIVDAEILLKLLLGNRADNSTSPALSKRLKSSKELLQSRMGKLHRSLKISGCDIIGLMAWFQDSIVGLLNNRTNSEKVDDFFIYLLKSAGYSPDFRLKMNRDRIAYYSYKTLAKFPTLSFVIHKILESEREYITESEYNNHIKLFTWLKGDAVSTEWNELPRPRHLDAILPDKGIIIQWDINAKSIYPEHLLAFSGNRRIIPDLSSSIYSLIQPHDFTLCGSPFLQRSDRITVAYPKLILMPDQVVDLIRKGVSIISNILPWGLLEDFHRGGFINGGIISHGIQTCLKLQVIYGSLMLKKELEQIYTGTYSGVSNKKYREIATKLKESTHRLNKDTRQYCLQIIYSEGPELIFFLKLIHKPIDDIQLKLVMETVLASSTIQEFRHSIIQFIFTTIIQEHNFTLEILHDIRDHTYGLYRIAPEILNTIFQRHLREIKQLLKAKRNPTLIKLRKNIFGNIILKQNSFEERNMLSSGDYSALKSKIQDFLVGNKL